MSGPSNPFSEEDDVTLPPRLAADLKALQRTPVVPPAVDWAIRDQARYHFARARLLARQGDATGARAETAKAAALDPANALAWQEQGLLLEQRKEARATR